MQYHEQLAKKARRNKKIAKMYAQGFTMVAIGKMQSPVISKERVRQIIKRENKRR